MSKVKRARADLKRLKNRPPMTIIGEPPERQERQLELHTRRRGGGEPGPRQVQEGQPGRARHARGHGGGGGIAVHNLR